MKIFDIEGCYPNMPKETIRFALRDILQKIQREKGHDAVYVPKFSNKQPCQWKSKRKTSLRIPFEVMLDVMDFSLDFAMVCMPPGLGTPGHRGKFCASAKASRWGTHSAQA